VILVPISLKSLNERDLHFLYFIVSIMNFSRLWFIIILKISMVYFLFCFVFH